MAVVVTQLAERLLPTPGVRGSNPVIGKIYNEHLQSTVCIVKTNIKKKTAPINSSWVFYISCKYTF